MNLFSLLKIQNKRSISIFFSRILPILSFSFLSCGEQSISTTGLQPILFKLEKPGTNNGKNAILFEVLGENNYEVMLSGEGFTASSGFEEFVPLPDRLDFSILSRRKVLLSLDIRYSDGTPFLSEEFEVEYSLEKPRNAVLSLSESATNDDVVFLLIANKDKNTKEVWVEGDLSDPTSQAGKWLPFDRSSKVTLNLKPGDGIKRIKTKVRNIFGTETELTELSVLKKSKGPENCSVQAISNKSQVDLTRLKLSAQNEGPLYYRVIGDVASNMDFVKFTGSVKTNIKLTKGEGKKKLTVMVRDEAENYCPRKNLEITVDPNHQPINIRLAGEPYYTLDPTVTVIPYFEAFSDEPVEMLLEGGIVESENSFQWIPMGSVDVTLEEPAGNRFVYVTYRDLNGVESPRISVPIYYKPILEFRGTAAPYYLGLSNMVGLSSLKIEGCQEGYASIEFSRNIACTPNSSTVRVTYQFENGTEFIKEGKPPGF